MSVQLTQQVVSPEDLIEPGSPRLAALLEAIAAGAAERERDRVHPYEQIQLIKDSRLGALRVPRERGGAGASLRDLFRILVALGAADSNVAHILRQHFAYVEQSLRTTDRAQRERWLAEAANGAIFGGAATELGNVKVGAETVATFLTRDGDGALRISGTKYYSTGSLYSDWLMLTASDEQGELAIVVIPADREGVTLEDDWDGIGQSLTGTGTTRLDNVLVEPDEVLEVRMREDGSFQRCGFLQLYITAVEAGVIRNAAEDAAALVRSREGRPFAHAPTERPADDPLLQEVVGEISSAAYAAEATVLIAAEAQDAEANSVLDGLPDEGLSHQASLEAAKAKVVIDELAFRATTRVFDVGGASATKKSKNLDRHWRNARTLSTHNPLLYKAQAVGDVAINGAPLPSTWFF
jgi:alkylation response protein AidB-like acyl-CoA dehydrogenase